MKQVLDKDWENWNILSQVKLDSNILRSIWESNCKVTADKSLENDADIIERLLSEESDIEKKFPLVNVIWYPSLPGPDNIFDDGMVYEPWLHPIRSE